MSRNFVELRKFLEQNFPELHGNITGETYPSPPIVAILTQLLGILQILFVVYMIAGDSLFTFIGMQPPEQLNWVKENKVMAFVGLMLTNSVLANMTKSGAFEVALNGEIIYSKLQTGQMPRGPEILRALEEIGLRRVRY